MDNFSSFLHGQQSKATRSDKDSDGEEITSILRNEQLDRCKFCCLSYCNLIKQGEILMCFLVMPFHTPTRFHSIDIMRDYAQEIESPYSRSKDALMNDEGDGSGSIFQN